MKVHNKVFIHSTSIIVSFNLKLLFPLYQVTCEYLFDQGACVPKRVHTIVVSVQHSDKIQLEELRAAVKEHVIKTVIPNKYYDDETIVHINPCGNFIIGGPMVC